MTYSQALKQAARGTFISAWTQRSDYLALAKAIGRVLFWIVVFVIRLLLLALSPITVPLIAWLLVLDERKMARQRADFERRQRELWGRR